MTPGSGAVSGRFDDRVVVVTGAASGMGAASARRFRAEGATVVLVDVDGGGAAGVAEELGISATDVIVGDVSESAFCDRAIDATVARHGHLDVLVNCAGTIHRADAAGTEDEYWRRVMAVNVDGVFYLSRAAVRHMAPAGRGAIVNFGSIWGDLGSAGVLAYCASKGAVHQITRAMALDHATDGIRVNAVAPGEVNTPMLASERPEPLTADDLDAMARATIPVERLADPDEIARVVVFLASDDASYMTGSIVPVDGGYSAR